MRLLLLILYISGILFSCNSRKEEKPAGLQQDDSVIVVRPVLVTDTVKYDSDDPAIWVNAKEPSQSLIIGTDKGGDSGDGALYVFNLQGKEVKEKTVRNIKRPNNVDVGYNFILEKQKIDIAVCTERNTNSLRVFRVPEMIPIDGGGIPVFENDTARAPMGIALYASKDGKMFAIVSRKNGPSGSYLWQYQLLANGSKVTAKLVRKFGNYSGKHEIESIAVDNESGYVYYSDEGVGVRKYYAHPDSSGTELALFGTTGFQDNHEGISIYKIDSVRGYIIISDQQANQFQIFKREGSGTNRHYHELVKVIKASTIESDGNDITSIPLPGFPNGLFVAMSDDKTFQYYRWKDILRIRNSLTHHSSR